MPPIKHTRLHTDTNKHTCDCKGEIGCRIEIVCKEYIIKKRDFRFLLMFYRIFCYFLFCSTHFSSDFLFIAHTFAPQIAETETGKTSGLVGFAEFQFDSWLVRERLRENNSRWFFSKKNKHSIERERERARPNKLQTNTQFLMSHLLFLLLLFLFVCNMTKY